MRCFILLLLSLPAIMLQAQQIRLSFEYPLQKASYELDYIATATYFDPVSMSYEKELLFSEDRKSFLWQSAPGFAMEISISVHIGDVRESFQFYLQANEKLHLHINQQVKPASPFFESESYYRARYQFKGAKARFHFLLLRHAKENKRSSYFSTEEYVRAYQDSAGYKILDYVQSQMSFRDEKFRENVPGESPEEQMFRDYIHDQALLSIGQNVIYSVQLNWTRLGMDTALFLEYMRVFHELRTGNYELPAYILFCNRIRISNLNTNYVSTWDVGFESYARSGQYIADELYKKQFEDSLKSLKGSAEDMLTRLANDFSRPVLAKRALNDLHFNGKMRRAFYVDSLLLHQLSKSVLPETVIIEKARSQLLHTFNGSGLNDLNFYRGDSIKLMYFTRKHLNLYKDFFKKHSNDLADASLDYMEQKSRANQKKQFPEFYRDVLYISSDVAIAVMLESFKGQVVTVVIMTKSFEKNSTDLMMLRKMVERNEELRQKMVLLLWAPGRNFDAVQPQMRVMDEMGILDKVEVFLIGRPMGLIQYDQDNEMSASGMMVYDKQSYLRKICPKPQGYSSFDAEEYRALQYPPEIRKSESIAYSDHDLAHPEPDYEMDEIPFPYDRETKPKAYSNQSKIDSGFKIVPYDSTYRSYPGYFEQIALLNNEDTNGAQPVYEQYFQQSFDSGVGWYVIKEESGSIILSKNKFRTTSSEAAERWIKVPDSDQLYFFDQWDRLQDSLGKISYNISEMTLTVVIHGLPWDYKILWYSNEICILIPMESYVKTREIWESR